MKLIINNRVNIFLSFSIFLIMFLPFIEGCHSNIGLQEPQPEKLEYNLMMKHTISDSDTNQSQIVNESITGYSLLKLSIDAILDILNWNHISDIILCFWFLSFIINVIIFLYSLLKKNIFYLSLLSFFLSILFLYSINDVFQRQIQELLIGSWLYLLILLLLILNNNFHNLWKNIYWKKYR